MALLQLLPFVGVVLLVWLLLVRPQNRRRQELLAMQSSLEVGDEVMLTSGVYGRLVGLDDDRVRLEVADGVVLQVARGAIGEVVPSAADVAARDDQVPGHTEDHIEEKS